MEGCIFCEIVAKKKPATICAETDFGIAIQDINSDDILLIPKLHLDCSAKSLASIANSLFQLLIPMKIDKCEIIIHIGWHVSIDHLHIRIRKKD